LQESKEFAAKVFSKQESFTVHNALFDKIYKKIIFERTNSKNKRIQGKSFFFELNLSGVPPSRIVRIHRATNDAL